MKRFLPLLLLLLTALWGCSRNEKVDSGFIKSDTPTLRVDGKSVFKYKPALHQMGYSAAQKKFWMGTDNLSDYYIVTFTDKFPSQTGQSVKGTLTYTTKDSEKTLKDLKFSVEKTDGQGQFWLWNSEKKIAVTVIAL